MNEHMLSNSIQFTDLFIKYKKQHKLSLRAIADIANQIMEQNDPSFMRHTTISNWTSGTSESIRNWDQALVIVFIFQHMSEMYKLFF